MFDSAVTNRPIFKLEKYRNTSMLCVIRQCGKILKYKAHLFILGTDYRSISPEMYGLRDVHNTTAYSSRTQNPPSHKVMVFQTVQEYNKKADTAMYILQCCIPQLCMENRLKEPKAKMNYRLLTSLLKYLIHI